MATPYSIRTPKDESETLNRDSEKDMNPGGKDIRNANRTLLTVTPKINQDGGKDFSMGTPYQQSRPITYAHRDE